MDLFTALADPTRRYIIEMLAASGRMSASEIFDRFDTSAPAVSQHLKVLRDADLVKVEKRAQKRLYRINPEKMIELEAWAKKMKKVWEGRFAAMGKVLTKEKKKV